MAEIRPFSHAFNVEGMPKTRAKLSLERVSESSYDHHGMHRQMNPLTFSLTGPDVTRMPTRKERRRTMYSTARNALLFEEEMASKFHENNQKVGTANEQCSRSPGRYTFSWVSVKSHWIAGLSKPNSQAKVPIQSGGQTNGEIKRNAETPKSRSY